MKWKYKLKAPQLNRDAYIKALHKHMEVVLAESLMYWLEAVLQEIPVWSGASQATFVKLAAHIQFGIPIVPVAIDRQWQGMSHSDSEYNSGRPSRGRYTFKYSTTLPWLIWNEYNNANVTPDPTLFSRVHKEGPYNFQVKGAKAFLTYADTVGLPSLRPFIKAVRVR